MFTHGTSTKTRWACGQRLRCRGRQPGKDGLLHAGKQSHPGVRLRVCSSRGSHRGWELCLSRGCRCSNPRTHFQKELSQLARPYGRSRLNGINTVMPTCKLGPCLTCRWISAPSSCTLSESLTCSDTWMGSPCRACSRTGESTTREHLQWTMSQGCDMSAVSGVSARADVHCPSLLSGDDCFA